MPTTRASLLSRVRDSADQEAWGLFEREYRELVLRYCRARGLQEFDAEDVLQIVMISLARALPNFTYRPELGRFRDYLGRAVRNTILRLRTGPLSSRATLRQVALPQEELEALTDPAGEEADEVWEREWMNHHYARALGSLRKSFRPDTLAVFEALVAGSSVPEVCARFGVDAESVYQSGSRVRRRLSELVAAQVRAEEFEERDG